MGQPFVGEIRIFGGNFPPNGWMFCQGQSLPISENEVLFQLIGTTFGGDGESTFNLPDLQGRVPVHNGTGQSGTTYTLGEKAGVESVTLTTNQLAAHSHTVRATSTGQVASATGALVAVATSNQAGVRVYGSQGATGTMNGTTVSPIGGNQPHSNLQPTLCMNYIISLFGIFPSPT